MGRIVFIRIYRHKKGFHSLDFLFKTTYNITFISIQDSFLEVSKAVLNFSDIK